MVLNANLHAGLYLCKIVQKKIDAKKVYSYRYISADC